MQIAPRDGDTSLPARLEDMSHGIPPPTYSRERRLRTAGTHVKVEEGRIVRSHAHTKQATS